MPVTRIDVEVSTDRAKQKLRELREEAIKSGIDPSGITPKVDSKTHTESYSPNIDRGVKLIIDRITNKGLDDISSKYTEIRRNSDIEEILADASQLREIDNNNKII